jgi:hypothetical protein
MDKFEPATILRTHRALLLAMEAIGWLHMTGKARTDFLREQAGQATGYDDRRWHEKESPPFPWDDLLSWVQRRFPKVDGCDIGWPNALSDFLTKHREMNRGLLGLLQAGHAMASGIEKNLPKCTSGYLGQDATHLWLSSAFGRPLRNLLSDPPDALTDAGWRRLLAEIRRILEELRSLGAVVTTDVGSWLCWRETAVGGTAMLPRAFSSTLAETRLPNNDVTLWDQSYVAAALFKSAVAGAILEGNAFPWTDAMVKNKTRWRLLIVGIGADHYEARAVRIGDWTGARLALDDFFARVRRLVEVDLAVGSLLYGDGKIHAFSFPGERLEGRDATSLDCGSWQTWLQEQIDRLAKGLDLETPPHCQISKPTRTLIPMATEIRQVRARLAAPLHRGWDIRCTASNGHVCPVCLVRHTARTDDRQEPCGPCRDRRTHRLDSWLQGRLGDDTIWIGEAADSNDRAALITIGLDIEPWLDGTRLDALRTQAIAEWRRFNPTLGGKANPIEPDQPLASLVRCVKARLGAYDKQDRLLSALQDGYPHEESWPAFYAKVVEDRSDAPLYGSLDDDGRARWLVHQLFRKLASPGRAHRFWRQAEKFFEQILATFRETVSRHANRWRVRRLVLEPDDSSKNAGWEDRVVYNGCWGDRPSAPVDLLYRAGTGNFVTVSNMARLLSANEPAETLKGAAIIVHDDNGTRCVLRVGRVCDDARALSFYHGIIPLELSPVRCRVIVPLEAASACVDRTVDEWYRQFARVWDRLPLKIGVVAFQRMTPFQGVIEAVRNLEERLESAKPGFWRVADFETREGVVALCLVRPQPDGRSELRTVPITVADGRTDVFYPYFAVQDREPRFPLDFQHPDGQVYRHTLDLRPGDGIYVHPAIIGTSFLGGTASAPSWAIASVSTSTRPRSTNSWKQRRMVFSAQRFDADITRPLADWRRMRHIWRVIRRASPSLSALHAAWDELLERQVSWRTPDGNWLGDGKRIWTDLVRAVLRDHLRLDLDATALDELVEAAEDGVLGWSLDWHLSVLKERIPEVAHDR